ncbi:MAG: cyanophycinase [Thermostichus sp. DG_1_6_bins_120]
MPNLSDVSAARRELEWNVARPANTNDDAYPLTHSAMEEPITTPSDIIAVGGAEDKENERHILWEFFRRAGGESAHITIVPAASGIPAVLGEIYTNIFQQMGAASLQVLNIRNPLEANDPEVIQKVRHCTGIYFTGGDQERLAEVLGHSDLIEAIRQQWLQGQTVIAGTSAGASALGQQMISRGYSGEPPTPAIVTVKTGLGLLPRVIIDQHFHQRNRLVRLVTAVAYYPECLGIGIDENTAVIIQADDVMEVIGLGTVTIVDGSQLHSTVQETEANGFFRLHNARLHFLPPGSRFDLKTLSPL